VGFAYDLFSHHRTAIRGGFAIMHSPIFGAQYIPHYTQNKPSESVTQSGPTFPVPFSSIAATKLGIQPGWDWFNTHTPYLIQYNFNIQHEILPGTVLTVGYVGSHGVHLITGQERNPISTILTSTKSRGDNRRSRLGHSNSPMITFAVFSPKMWGRLLF
jgi:hypothetical protein